MYATKYKNMAYLSFLSTDYRATRRKKGKKPKSKRLKIEKHEDPEIQAEINKGNTVRIIRNWWVHGETEYVEDPSDD